MGLTGRWKALRAAVTEDEFRRRYTNVGHLLSGNAATLVLGLGAVALTARTLGPAGYGILALIISYAQAIDALVNFQTWQPLIRYGAKLDDDAHREELMVLFKFGFLLDMAAAAAGWLIAIAAALVAGYVFDWDRTTYVLVFAYSAVLLFRINGTPVAILRLAGKFRAAAYLQVISIGVRLILCAIAFLAGAGILTFVLIWMATQILGEILLVAGALFELRRRGLHRLFRSSLTDVGKRFPGLWRFTWSANLSLTLWSSAQQLDTLLVGALTDPASAGLYHLAKRVGRVALQAGAQVQAVVYPEIARLWAAYAFGEFGKIVVQTELLLALFGLALLAVMLVAAEPLMYWMAGPEFVAAAPLLVVQMVAVALVLSGSVARSGLLAMGRERELFALVLLVIVVFYSSAVLLVPVFGAMGANIAHVALGFVWVVGLGLLFRWGLRRAQRDAVNDCAQDGPVKAPPVDAGELLNGSVGGRG